MQTLAAPFAPYLERLLLPGTVARLRGEVSEHQHCHVLSSLLGQVREVVVEVYYQRKWRADLGARVCKARADIWCPPAVSLRQTYVEVKLAFLHDETSNLLGRRTYGLSRAAPSWADDVYRLLVGPEGECHCGFVLTVFGPGSKQFIRAPTMRARAPQRKDLDADDVWKAVRALQSRSSSAKAIEELVIQAQAAWGAHVTQLDARYEKSLDLWYAPLLFEWFQRSPAPSSYSV